MSVALQADTLAEARAALDRGEAFAVVGIPPGTQRDVLKGISAHLPIYADATYLFIFRSTGTGIVTAINTLSSDSPPAVRAPTAAFSRHRSRHRARPTSCCSRFSTRSAATPATSSLLPSC